MLRLTSDLARRSQGHFAEGGLGPVDENGHVALLVPVATPKVKDTIRSSPRERSIRPSTEREALENVLETGRIEEI